MRAAILCLLLICVGLPARAQLYRCVDASGSMRLTDRARDCPGAQPIAPAPSADPSAPALPAPSAAGARAALASHFLPVGELVARDAGWRAIDEPPEPVDPELRRHGLVDTAMRHYARAAGPVSEVCSIELWRFGSPAAARAVAASLALPDWQVLRADALLVLAHGVRLERRVGSSGRLAADCAEIGRATHARLDGGR